MAALAPTRPAHLGRTVPTGAVPAAVPPAHTHPGPAWWSAARPRRGAAEEPPPRSALSPGATAVSSSRPGAPPAPSAAPAPRAPSRSADPAQPRRDARVARTAPVPGRPLPGAPGPRTAAADTGAHGRGHGPSSPPDCTQLWPSGLPHPPRRQRESAGSLWGSSLGEAGGLGAPSGAGAFPTMSPGSHYQQAVQAAPGAWRSPPSSCSPPAELLSGHRGLLEPHPPTPTPTAPALGAGRCRVCLHSLLARQGRSQSSAQSHQSAYVHGRGP